jgi:hypothetical protein
MISKWLKIAFANFLLAAVLGVLLRYAFVTEIPWMKFRNVMHGHSHVAMLGWLYLALYALFVHAFLPKEVGEKPFYNRVFWLTQLSVLGMLISFPVTGYGFISIFFSTLHVVMSYVFIVNFWKDAKLHNPVAIISVRWALASLVMMVISSLGLWALAPIMVIDPDKGTAYYMAIQFYLHFQFNGWFMFAVLALFFRMVERKRIQLDARIEKRFFILLTISCLLTYVLALTWANPKDYLFYINGSGVLIQLAALLFFWKLLQPRWQELKAAFPAWVKWLLLIAFLCFSIKIIVQAAVVIPFIAKAAYTIRNYVIGFFHLMLLGIATHLVLGFAVWTRLLPIASRTVRLGLILFMAGFALSEAVLFLQGSMFWAAMGFLPGYYLLLTLVSALMPLGLILVMVKFVTPQSQSPD